MRQVQPTLKVRQIVSGPNHRTYYDPRQMAELEEGMVAAGRVTQPIQVRPHPTQASVWEIIAGERRWRAAGKLFGDDSDMPVVITDASDAEVRALGIIENPERRARKRERRSRDLSRGFGEPFEGFELDFGARVP